MKPENRTPNGAPLISIRQVAPGFEMTSPSSTSRVTARPPGAFANCSNPRRPLWRNVRPAKVSSLGGFSLTALPGLAGVGLVLCSALASGAVFPSKGFGAGFDAGACLNCAPGSCNCAFSGVFKARNPSKEKPITAIRPNITLSIPGTVRCGSPDIYRNPMLCETSNLARYGQEYQSRARWDGISVEAAQTWPMLL